MTLERLSELTVGYEPDDPAAAEIRALVPVLIAERNALRKACDSVLWLENNIHNYGSPEWKEYFIAAADDCRAALKCPSCQGLGFQAGAHTERINPCPTCGGSGES